MSQLIKYIKENNLDKEKFTGEVLWYDNRKGQGIMVTCEENHEVYFDSSVISMGLQPIRGQLLEFEFNTSITDCTCAKNVTNI